MSDSFWALASSAWEMQKLRLPSMDEKAPVFYRNLEERLDKRRAEKGLLFLRLPRTGVVDFSSNDFLSLGSSGLVRMAFFDEMARYPNFALGSTGSRLLDGNNSYTEMVEGEIAKFQGSESAVLFNSGYEANGAILSAIPQPGDVIVYDELIHASVHDGMKHSAATVQRKFRHNDPASFRELLKDITASEPLIRYGHRTVIVCIESVYSMDGDVSPVNQLIDVAKEVLPPGQVQFVIDEAHTTGVIGPQGRGLIAHLGLENEMAIRLHTFGKALASTGAAILCNRTIKETLVNYARSLIYTTGPSFPSVAAIRGAYRLLESGLTADRQANLQSLIRHFFSTITAKPAFHAAQSSGVLSMPVLNDGGIPWQERDFVAHVVPIWTRPKENHLLVFHLQYNDYVAWPIDHPVVPRGTARVRLVFHADNTFAQVERLAELVIEWAVEMMQEDTAAAAREGSHIGTSNPAAKVDAELAVPPPLSSIEKADAVLSTAAIPVTTAEELKTVSSTSSSASTSDSSEPREQAEVYVSPVIGGKDMPSVTTLEIKEEGENVV